VSIAVSSPVIAPAASERPAAVLLNLRYPVTALIGEQTRRQVSVCP
jgi:hypothetical protein